MANEISRVERDLPPAHYTLKTESFSLLVKSEKEKYESDTFEAGSYKWRLVLYPDGNKKRNGNCHISLYLEIDGVESFSDNWEVFVNFKLFVFDQIHNKYLTIQDVDGKVRRFHKMKTKWGFDQLVSFEDFYNSSKGYLVNGCCAFGAEVFVIKPTHKGETLSMVKLKPPTDKAILTSKIENFSKSDKKVHYSNKYAVGDRKWKIKIYRKGYDSAEGDYLSVT
ncbi:ubiquitin carboxyl-terminal hydrolase 12-like [Pistacia vera]|uniref:ubiquitin carboxyl-terminal hydrolase 12-like n=1 Tax=Pistacia vera TaxID=55513 RepID=UPI0012631129|nr:ubiquitin carboxyl-terminal hydrolase 12-like [Pistacia vera]